MKPSSLKVDTPMLELSQVHAGYPGLAEAVVQDVSFALPAGDIACLLGPSGCGKTTLLRAIAGFASVQRGSIAIAGREVSSASSQVPTEQRLVGMVFQDYALFPHLTVAGNVGFGLRGLQKRERLQRVSEMLDLVGLGPLANTPIHEISGGQQQRVALARALAPRPQLLLLDEPFSNLDVALRLRLAEDVRALIRATGTTAVMVTHDQQEAFTMADHIAVLAERRIQQWGTPLHLYHQPANRFVADFLGEGVWIPATLGDGGKIHTELGVFDSPITRGGDGALELLVRPDDILHDDASPHRALVVARTFRGASFLYTLALPSGQRVSTLVPSHHDHQPGEEIGIRLDLDHLVCFPSRHLSHQ